MEGRDADLVIGPGGGIPRGAGSLHQRHKLMLYATAIGKAWSRNVFARQRQNYERGEFPVGPIGNILKRIVRMSEFQSFEISRPNGRR